MDGKKPVTTGGSGRSLRTPQPPPPVATSSTTKSRSRSSTPTAATASAPSVTSLVGARSSDKSGQPKAKTNNNHNDSPRSVATTRKPRGANEPATDDGDPRGDHATEEEEDSSGDSAFFRESEVTLATMDKQMQDAARRNQKSHARYTTMRDSMAGKEERMGALQKVYATMSRELEQLESFSSADADDLDPAALNELYMTIPLDQRTLLVDDEP